VAFLSFMGRVTLLDLGACRAAADSDRLLEQFASGDMAYQDETP